MDRWYWIPGSVVPGRLSVLLPLLSMRSLFLFSDRVPVPSAAGLRVHYQVIRPQILALQGYQSSGYDTSTVYIRTAESPYTVAAFAKCVQCDCPGSTLHRPDFQPLLATS